MSLFQHDCVFSSPSNRMVFHLRILYNTILRIVSNPSASRFGIFSENARIMSVNEIAKTVQYVGGKDNPMFYVIVLTSQFGKEIRYHD